MSLSNKKSKKFIGKLLHRKYRRYGDIWGRLALKKRNNFITNLVYSLESQAFARRRKKLPYKLKRKMRKKFYTKGKKRESFAFQIHSKIKQPRRRRLSRRGNLLKLRRQISLYYGGGKIRKKTFRRYGRHGADTFTRKMGEFNEYQSNVSYNYGSIFESRIDVLLLRANFVDSIYTARIFVLYHKAFIAGYHGLNNPAVFVPCYTPFGIRGLYHIKLRKILFTRIKKHAILSLPSYLFFNLSLLLAFKIEEPFTAKVSFPFSEQAGTGAIFRKIFSYM